MFRIGQLVVVVLGVTMAPALAADALTHAEWAKKMQGKFAYGVYFSGKKAGYIIEEYRLGKHEGKDVFRTSSETYLATLYEGQKSVKHDTTVTCYELTGDGEIVFSETRSKEDGKETHRKVEREPRGLRITTKQGSRTLVRTAALAKDTIANQRDLEVWLTGARKNGDRFARWTTAWDKTNVNSKQEYLFKQKRTITWEGKPTTVFDVRVRMDGGNLDAQVRPDARPLRGTTGGLMSMRLENELAARKMGQLVDLKDISSIFVDKDLGRARDVDRLVVDLTGLEDFKVPPSHRQRVDAKKSSKGKTRLELRRDYRVEKAMPLSKEEKQENLKSTPRFQSDNETVKNLARKIVGEERDPLKAARKIETWVYKNLEKSYMDNADTALEILDNKAGDCTEHSLLFVALARAAGIPAREAGGVAYVPDTKPMFGWHAWAEFHDGHQWVSVDPTWHQVYVDGTHLKLSDGDEDLAWTNVAGTLRIKIVEFESRR